MPNSYFQFKQFRVKQDRSDMKVTTEGCLLGALVALHGDEEHILDIGTGTGLLSLMLAQRSTGTIDAVELSEAAAQQAAENFENSPWKERLHVYQGTIQDYAKFAGKCYDLIVSNPPFFKDHLKSGKAKDRAIHNDDLPPEDLAQSVKQLLARQGRLWVIYPAYEFEQFLKVAAGHHLLLQHQYEIYDRPGKPIFRVIGVFGFEEKEDPDHALIYIKESEGGYSSRFQGLVEAYYL